MTEAERTVLNHIADNGIIDVQSESRTIEPYGDLVLIEKVNDEDITAGGILIPEAARDSNFPTWKVLAAGTGYGGRYAEVPLFKYGDLVVVSPDRAGFMTKVPGRKKLTLLIEHRGILGKVGTENGA